MGVVAICAAAYLYVFPYQPKLNNPNENVRVYMTAALVEDGTYRIDAIRRRWGWVNDAACVDTLEDGTRQPCERRLPPGAERHYFSVKAPGTSFLGVPGYAAYRAWTDGPLDRAEVVWVLRVTGTAVWMILFLPFFYRWLGRRTSHPLLRDAIFFSVALGSLLFGYTNMFASHTQSAVCGFGAFMILYDGRHRQPPGPFGAALAGLLAAATSLFEYPCFFVSAFLCVYALTSLRPWHRLVPFALGAAIPTLAMMHFQWSAFGDPLSPGHLFVENPAFRQGHQEGFYGAQEFHWEAAWRLLVDPRLGMFSLSPLLAFFLPGAFILLLRRGERLDASVAIVITAVMYVMICFMNIWHAGWSVGPRYLAVLAPFLGWLALAGLDALASRMRASTYAVALGATAAAFVTAGLPSAYYPHLPPAFDFPLAHLFPVLLAHDFAPYNAGNLAGVWGTASMAPLAGLMLIALALVVVAAGNGARRKLVVLIGGTPVALALVLAQVLPAPEPSPKVRKSVAFVTRTWSPAGHDRAARLEAQLRATKAPDPAGWRRLAELYREEGRVRLAEVAERRAEAAARRRRAL